MRSALKKLSNTPRSLEEPSINTSTQLRNCLQYWLEKYKTNLWLLLTISSQIFLMLQYVYQSLLELPSNWWSASPLLGNLMLQVKWPHPDPEINGLKSVERDIKLGIGQGCFNKMPLAIGVSLDIGSMIGGSVPCCKNHLLKAMKTRWLIMFC